MRFLILVLLFSTASSHAYLPPSENILKQTSALQGNRGYRVVLETRLNNDAENLAFKETWTIKDDLSMHLTVAGITPLTLGFMQEYVYSGSRRFRLNKNGEVVSLDLGGHHFERYFHFRDASRFKEFLIQNQIIPKPEPREEEPLATTQQNLGGQPESETNEELEKSFTYQPDPFLHLTRLAGTITYFLGIPSPRGQSELSPGLWIEQDRFHVRKLRTPSLSEMNAHNYYRYRGLSFPKTREIKWKGNSVTISLIKIQPVSIGPITRKSLEPMNLKKSNFNSQNQLSESLSSSIMTEFYQRFR